MKKIILAAAALFAVASCSQKQSFKIDGTVEGVAGKAVLSYKNPVSKTEVNDTVAIENGKFIFEGVAEDVVPADITIIPEGEESAGAKICLENDSLAVNLDWSSVKSSRRTGRIIVKNEVNGGVNNTFKNEYAAVPDKVLSQEKYKEYREAREALDKIDMRADFDKYMKEYQVFMDKFGAQYDSLQVETNKACIDFIKSNPDVECAADEFSKFIANMSLEEMEEVFNLFTQRVQNSFMARPVKREIEALNAVKPGNPAPEFTLKNLTGEEFSLSSLKGKYVILDFWASWCGPCRASIPGVKELYAKYKDKGLEIVGVSCDRKAEDWRKASEEEQFPWINLIDNQKGGSVASKYAVHYIPSMYLLDKEGKIVGKMNHDELDAKLKELLGE